MPALGHRAFLANMLFFLASGVSRSCQRSQAYPLTLGLWLSFLPKPPDIGPCPGAKQTLPCLWKSQGQCPPWMNGVFTSVRQVNWSESNGAYHRLIWISPSNSFPRAEGTDVHIRKMVDGAFFPLSSVSHGSSISLWAARDWTEGCNLWHVLLMLQTCSPSSIGFFFVLSQLHGHICKARTQWERSLGCRQVKPPSLSQVWLLSDVPLVRHENSQVYFFWTCLHMKWC